MQSRSLTYIHPSASAGARARRAVCSAGPAGNNYLGDKVRLGSFDDEADLA